MHAVSAVLTGAAANPERTIPAIESDEDSQILSEIVQTKLKGRALTAEEYQYEAKNRDGAIPIEIELETQQGEKGGSETREPQHDLAYRTQQTIDVDRECDKIGMKRDKPNPMFSDEQIGNEYDGNDSDDARKTPVQSSSPKRTKKIKMEREQTRTRSKMRLKTPQHA